MTEEEKRLQESNEHTQDWKRWGPYLSERAWGTVREDYSADGSAWDYFPHDHARSKAYRWNEDGILGISDRRQFLCFGLALWNGKDPILKERMFGLTGSEGNHGEDVKEYYYYLDSSPTHSYMKGLYKYPQAEFPYADLLAENRRRNRDDFEYELMDTGVFNENRYFDVFVEYAKASPEDVLIQITIANRGPESAFLHVLPTLWFRNTWAWTDDNRIPTIALSSPVKAQKNAIGSKPNSLIAHHTALGDRWLYFDEQPVKPEPLFTNNETNNAHLYGMHGTNVSSYVKDGINNYVVHGEVVDVNPHNQGTKAALNYKLTLAPGETKTIRLRMRADESLADPLGDNFTQVFEARKRETDEFYATLAPEELSEDGKNVQRQAFAGMLWSKQFYNYAVDHWLDGDPAEPAPPASRKEGRNKDWRHLNNADILSMPDKWEYPWYAAWDLAFHCIPLALVDPHFAKRQLTLMLREWFMHPNGQLPAYEWAFGDVNPPVHAWAVWPSTKSNRSARASEIATFWRRLSTNCFLTSPGGSIARISKGETFFRAAFWGWTISGCSTAARRCQQGSFWSSRTEPPGWDSTP